MEGRQSSLDDPFDLQTIFTIQRHTAHSILAYRDVAEKHIL